MTDVTLRSFDIFDTLVARRCVEPHAVFRAVEARSGHAGFAAARIKAEAAVAAKGDYDLAAIYRALVAGGVSQVAAARLQALELEIEFAELIPVREHLAEVRPGDLLISDMYLPRAFIERVVRETCGLHFNPLYLSSHGKRSGRAWESLGRALTIAEHLGDNLHSDIEMCRRAGVQARHTEVAKLTAGEALVAEMGFRELALSMREARLALWSDDPGELALGRAQIEVNFPLLFLTGLLLIEAATRIGWKRLLFSSRDCFLLYNLVRRLSDRLGVDIASSYFFTSRVARVFPSDAYITISTACASVARPRRSTSAAPAGR